MALLVDCSIKPTPLVLYRPELITFRVPQRRVQNVPEQHVLDIQEYFISNWNERPRG